MASFRKITNELAKTCRPHLPQQPHRKIINDLLDTVRNQEHIVKHLIKDLEFFRNQFKYCLEYDNGTGNYLAVAADDTIDLRSFLDVGNGTIKGETADGYVGYKAAGDNFQKGVEKTNNQIEKIWEGV